MFHDSISVSKPSSKRSLDIAKHSRTRPAPKGKLATSTDSLCSTRFIHLASASFNTIGHTFLRSQRILFSPHLHCSFCRAKMKIHNRGTNKTECNMRLRTTRMRIASKNGYGKQRHQPANHNLLTNCGRTKESTVHTQGEDALPDFTWNTHIVNPNNLFAVSEEDALCTETIE